MRCKFSFLLLFCCLLGKSHAQWEIKWQQAITAETFWDLDLAGRVLISERQTLKLKDTNGAVLQQQSSKSLGDLTAISANNRLKIAVFSADQQQICFFDNALAQNGPCIDLSQLDFTQAQNMCLSQQTDRLWVFDQYNSQLRLIGISQQLNQKTTNVAGILGIGEVRRMVEQDQVLFIYDGLGKVAWFDKYGNLLETRQLPTNWSDIQEVKALKDQTQRIVLGLNNRSIERVEGNTTIEVVKLPEIGEENRVKLFRINGKILYFSTENMLYCAVWRGGVLVE